MSHEQMKTMIAGFGDQLRWAADLDPVRLRPATLVLVAGMGGSGISGDFAAALADVPVFVNKGYGLADLGGGVATPRSGDVLLRKHRRDAVGRRRRCCPGPETGGGDRGRDARRLGRRVRMADGDGSGGPAAPGSPGLSPWWACCTCSTPAGATSVARHELLSAADMADSIAGDGGSGWALARGPRRGTDGRIVAVYGGGGITSPVAQRWKTQINENAKWPAWHSALPELDHNEIVSWTSLAELTRATGRDRQPAGSRRGPRGDGPFPAHRRDHGTRCGLGRRGVVPGGVCAGANG